MYAGGTILNWAGRVPAIEQIEELNTQLAVHREEIDQLKRRRRVMYEPGGWYADIRELSGVLRTCSHLFNSPRPCPDSRLGSRPQLGRPITSSRVGHRTQSASPCV